MYKLDFLNTLRLEAEKQTELVQMNLVPLNPELLNQQRSDGGWSVSQCLKHLNTYSDHYLLAINNSLFSYPQSNNVVLKGGWLGKYFVKIIQPGKGKYKAAKKHLPPISLDHQRELSDFMSNTAQFIEMLDECALVNLDKARVKTSIHPWLTLRLCDTLEFMIAHNQRHLLQALNNVKHQKSIAEF